jgi:hypothetical protein
MADPKQFNRWAPSRQDLQGLDPIKARDLIINCFFEAQRETFVRAKKTLNLQTDAKSVQESVSSAVRMAFREAGEDFDRPSRASLQKVVQVLAARSAGWGTPPDIIEYHRGHILKILDQLPA